MNIVSWCRSNNGQLCRMVQSHASICRSDLPISVSLRQLPTEFCQVAVLRTSLLEDSNFILKKGRTRSCGREGSKIPRKRVNQEKV